MFSRCSVSTVARRSQNRLSCCGRQKNTLCRSIQRKGFSTSKTHSSDSSVSHVGERPLFSGLTDELDRIAPRFDVDGEDIEILQEPSDFFEALKVGCDALG